jgi:hypothetical protein
MPTTDRAVFLCIEPQNPTPTDKLITRARDLVNQPNRDDCKALVELIGYARDLFRNVIEGTNQLGNVLAGPMF